MRKIRVMTLVSIAAFIFVQVWSSVPAAAQTFYGSIVGVINDSTGAVVPNATITLSNTGTGETKVARSDANGGYVFVNLVPASYKADIEAASFKHTTIGPIEVKVDTVSRANAVLQVGAVSETVTVTNESQVLQTDTVALGQVIEQRQVLETPLNGRNIMNMLGLVAGVVPQGSTDGNPMSSQNGGIFTSVQAFGNYQIGGGFANQSVSFLDGAPINLPLQNATVIVPTQDAIQEFNVATSDVSAEFGGFSGGVVNMTTKSGSNTFHGSAYEYFRNTLLNANDFFNNRNAIARPFLHQNQYGASATGPLVRNSAFFSAFYEGFALRKGMPTTTTVPTAAMRKGDFSGVSQTIYDPLTTCGQLGNAACVGGVVTRQPFANNQLTRIDPTAQAMLALWALPTKSGNVNNLVFNMPVGGDNQQANGRVDYNLGAKQRLFARYTFMHMKSLPADPFNNKTGYTQVLLKNQQVTIGDTVSFNQTTVGDFRVSYLRMRNENFAPNVGIDESQFGSNWKTLSGQMAFTAYPSMTVSGGYWRPMVLASTFRVNDLTFVGNLTKIVGGHTLKFGAQVRHDLNALINCGSCGGNFSFDATPTSLNATNSSTSGYSFASYMLGYPTSGSIQAVTMVYQALGNQGAYITDTYQLSRKLTLNYGIRWDQPGAFTEKKDRDAMWMSNLTSPLAQSTGLALKGKLALVNSTDYPSRKDSSLIWNQFSPRFGFAYRLTDKTVIRGGYGINRPPYNVGTNGPQASAVNTATTTMAASLNGGQTPNATLSNPFPSGMIQPAGRTAGFLDSLQGTAVTAYLPNIPATYVQQWNFNIQRQLARNMALQVGYAAAKGTHLYMANMVMNQLPSQYFSQGTALLNPVVNNPFYGILPTSVGVLGQKTIAPGYLLKPYSQYLKVTVPQFNGGSSTYNALQARFEKRFAQGASVTVNYTWSKFLSNANTATSQLEGGPGQPTPGAIQDYTNLSAEKSVTDQNVPQRLVASYVYDLPFGKNRKYLSDASGVLGAMISGWGVNGITTLAKGYPMPIIAQNNTLTSSFNAGAIRPNYAAGCARAIGGSAQSRLSKWFNTDCFTQPANYTMGNESRTDPKISTDGIANWDIALNKKTQIREKMTLAFDAQFINTFNRVQFFSPGNQLGTGTYGVVSSARNQPRLVQFALRITY